MAWPLPSRIMLCSPISKPGFSFPATEASTGSVSPASIPRRCFPRFDSPSLFAALLGTDDHGRWLLASSHSSAVVTTRCYVDSTFVLQTTWETATGRLEVTDFMPVGLDRSSFLRRITGLDGRVEMHQQLIIRPGYGRVVPWVSRT